MHQRRSDELAEAAAQNFRHAELRVVGCEYEIVAVHDAERAAQAIAVHLRDDDARETAQRFGHLHRRRRAIPVARLLAHLAQKVQIEAGGKTNPRPFGDHDLDVAIGAHDVERLEPSRHQRLVEAVALVGPVENDPRNARILELLQNEFRPLFQCAPLIGHRLSPVALAGSRAPQTRHRARARRAAAPQMD